MKHLTRAKPLWAAHDCIGRLPASCEFRDRVAGRFIHHLPGEPGEEDSGAGVGTTVAAMRELGHLASPDHDR